MDGVTRIFQTGYRHSLRTFCIASTLCKKTYFRKNMASNPYDGGWYGKSTADRPKAKTDQPYFGGRFRGGGGSRRGGYRGRSRRSTHHGAEDGYPSDRPSSSRGRGRGGRGQRPPGLSGREIGLWYAEQGKQKRLEKELQDRKTIHMDEQQVGQVKYVLAGAKQQENQNILKQSASCSKPHENIPMSKSEEQEAKFSDLKDILPFSNTDDAWFSTPFKFDAGHPRNITLQKELEEKRTEPKYKRMQGFREKLPAFKKKIALLKLINSEQVIVISGETGCGKTTQVPQFILDEAIEKGEGTSCKVVCTQPRRISAISVAERVCEERAEKCGYNSSCGYQIRLDSKLPRPDASILYCTTGILIQWLKTEACLQNVSHIVLDEIHERDLHTDFLITIIKGIVAKRKDLKVILMSATLNAELFSSYFGNCSCFHIPGFTYPVESMFLEEVMDFTQYQPPEAAYKLADDIERLRNGEMRRKQAEKLLSKNIQSDFFEKWIKYENSELVGKFSKMASRKLYAMHAYTQTNVDSVLILETIRYIVNEQPKGAILVFVPGWMDIKSVNEQLQRDRQFSSNCFLIIPLHSMMPTTNQRKVFDRPPNGVTKIVIATNIAETSITIDDVVHVIDSGKIKLTDFDHNTNISSLQMRWVSRANAKQRRGRAGRVQEGFCYHLYTKLQEKDFEDFHLPEMLRTPLDQLCLQIRVLELGKIEDFLSKVMEPPHIDAIHLSVAKLIGLSAMDSEQNLTPLGYHLAKLPVEPQIGKMILMGAMFSCLDPILTIAANLSFKDPFVIPLGKEKDADRQRKELADGCNSDHLMLLNAFQGWEKARNAGYQRENQYCWENFLAKSTLSMLKDMKGQFAYHLHKIGFIPSTEPGDPAVNKLSQNMKVVTAIVCSGLYPNICKIMPTNPKRPVKIQTKTEKKIDFHPKSVNYGAMAGKFSEQWLCYYLKMKTSSIYVFDSSEVTAYPLLFFGGKITSNYDVEMKGDVIAVDDWIKFKSKPRIAELVQDLRRALDDILEKKIRNPDITVLTNDDTANKVLSSIVDLITTE